MVKPNWGMKRICLDCGEKFYDLGKDPIICPHCKTIFHLENAIRLKRGKSIIADDETKSEQPLSEDDTLLEDDDLDTNITDDNDNILEDTSDLDDKTDVTSVITNDKDDL